MACFGRGGQVGAQGAELFGSGESTHAAGDLLPDFHHAYLAFRGIVVERDPMWIMREAQVVTDTGVHPLGQGVQFLAQLEVCRRWSFIPTRAACRNRSA